MEPSLKKKAANQTDKLSRRHLPFYMQLPILISFIVVSVVGQIAWTAAVHLSRVDTSWCGVGFAAGVVLGFIQGKWTVRMWERDYMRVLSREIAFWDARGGERYNHFCGSRARYADTFWIIGSANLRHFGGASIVCFWVCRGYECGAGAMGAAAPSITESHKVLPSDA